ncbi:hypothetical protein [Mycobacterium sp. MMS18-G62]
MPATTDVVQRKRSLWHGYRRHGYFFREAAMLTIAMGFGLHLYRVIFGDELAMKYVVTLTTDKILLVPMTYAAITGILVWHRVRFVNTPHKAFFTASVFYIAASVPLHIYFNLVRGDIATFFTWFPMWFSYVLLIVVYPAFLTMFWRLHYRN